MSQPESTVEQIDSRASSAPARVVKSKLFQILASFVLIFGLLAWIQFAGPAILDNDGYYHIRWSKMLRQSAPHLPVFNWLPLTILDKKDYVDHHFLFHVLLMPFTFGDLRIGAKIAAALYSSIGITGVFALLVIYNVPYRWFWLTAMVAGSEPFLYRMSMTRAPGLTLLLLGLGAYLILERKLVWLAVVGFVFVWLYSLFPLLFAFAIIYSVSRYIADRRIEVAAVVASGLGIIAGLVVNPYYPRDLVLFGEHVAMTLKPNYPVEVGVEWYPYADTWILLSGSAVALTAYFTAVLAFDFKKRAEDLKPLFFLIVSTMLVLITFKSRRFLEYSAPFVVVYAAFVLGPAIQSALGARLKKTRDPLIAAAAAAMVVAAFVIGLGYNVAEAAHEVSTEPSPYEYRGAGDYLMKNTAPGSLVFNVDWDAFGKLFYYDTQNRYVAGLDPRYLYKRNHDLWKAYDDITNGNSDHPGRQIRDLFGTEYAVASVDDSDFLGSASDSGEFDTVYKDSYAVVLKVKAPGKSTNKNSDEGDAEEGDGPDN